jgi:hypothetical protein
VVHPDQYQEKLMTEVPDYIQNRPSRGLTSRVSSMLGTSSPPYLSIMDNKFTLVDAAGNEQPIPTFEGTPEKCMRGQIPGPYADVMVIDINDHVSRIFYDVGFDRNAQSYQPPACFSHNGLAPSQLASKPQSPTCAACPNSVWGSATSAVTGKGIPACAQYLQVAILVAGHQMPFLLRIPPNTLKNFRAYIEQFRGQTFEIDSVMTRLSFAGQGTLAFIPSARAPKDMLAICDKLITGKMTDAMVGRLDVPIQAALAPPAERVGPTAGGSAPLPISSNEQAPAGQGQAAPPRGRRRNTAAAPVAAQPASLPPPQAPFMPQNPPTPEPKGSQPVFGMAPGAPPNADVSAMLDNLFGPAK